MSDDDTTGTDQVRFERRGAAGVITLDRPKAINSLTTPMVDAMTAQLTTWQTDDDVALVVLVGAGERGLCAGGDVVAMRAGVMAGPKGRADAITFWMHEYDLDALIGDYPKPVVAVMDGVTMGGGVGIAGHASHRIVTERSKIAMPETIIGFFPDVGGLHLLAQAPGEIGTHLALTGSTVTGADAVALGMADVLIDSVTLPDLLDRLTTGRVPAFDELGDTTPQAPILSERPWIDACYGGDDAGDVVARLRAHSGQGEDQAHEAAGLIEARSPFSVTVTLRAIRNARRLGTLEHVLEQDRLLAHTFADEPDFREGVRALLVDKDKNPRWRHDSLADVPTEEIDAAFAPR